MVFMPMIIQKLDFYGNARLDKFLSSVLLFNLKCDIVGLGVASAPANMVRFCVGSAPMAFTRFFHFLLMTESLATAAAPECAPTSTSPLSSDVVEKPKRSRVVKPKIKATPTPEQINVEAEPTVSSHASEPVAHVRVNTANNETRPLRVPDHGASDIQPVQVRPEENRTEKDVHPNDKPYIAHAESWNALSLQPYRIASLVLTDKMHAVVERKNLEENHELRDWFDDARIGAVMRGEKIVSPGEFWNQLFRQSIASIQNHFDGLSIRIVDTTPQGKHRMIWGRKPQKVASFAGPDPHQSGVEKTVFKKHPKKKGQFPR